MSDNSFSIREVDRSKWIPDDNTRLSSVLIIAEIKFNHTVRHTLNNPRVPNNAKIAATIIQVAIISLCYLSLSENSEVIQYIRTLLRFCLQVLIPCIVQAIMKLTYLLCFSWVQFEDEDSCRDFHRRNCFSSIIELFYIRELFVVLTYIYFHI